MRAKSRVKDSFYTMRQQRLKLLVLGLRLYNGFMIVNNSLCHSTTKENRHVAVNKQNWHKKMLSFNKCFAVKILSNYLVISIWFIICDIIQRRSNVVRFSHFLLMLISFWDPNNSLVKDETFKNYFDVHPYILVLIYVEVCCHL